VANPTSIDGTLLVKSVTALPTPTDHICLMMFFQIGWFQGLSSHFLAARTARLLVLAGTDRLDKELMIGQMQGKFQMAVVPGVGHMLHEVWILIPFLIP